MGLFICQERTCCFFGHREIEESEALRERVLATVEELIVKQGVDTFLFGGKSRFDSLCYEQVTELKKNYPHIKRVYVRAEYPCITEDYRRYLLLQYEDTYFSEKANGAGKAVYIKRNCDMIDKSGFCVVYCREDYAPLARKSGAKQALAYALKQGKVVIQTA